MRPRRLSFEHLEERAQPDATGFTDIPDIRSIPERALVQLHPELFAEISTACEVNGTTGSGGILRSIGDAYGKPSSPDAPYAMDALVLQLPTAITRPFTIQLWAGDPLTFPQAYAFVNSPQWMVRASAEGKIEVDASPDRPVTYLSVLSTSRGTYGIDSFTIAGDPPATPALNPAAVDDVMADIQNDVIQTVRMPDDVAMLITEAARMAEAEPVWEAMSSNNAATTLPKGSHINLRGETSVATGFDATLQSTATTTVTFFRGDTVIHQMNVAAGAKMHYENANGITDVVLRSTGSASATGITVLHDGSAWSGAMAPLTPLASREYALAAAKSIPQPKDVLKAAQALDVRDGLSGISKGARILLQRDANQYSLVRLRLNSGDGWLSMLRGIEYKGLDYRRREIVDFIELQNGYVEKVDDRTLLIAPGMPGALVLWASFPQTSNYTIQVTNGASREALLPPKTLNKQTLDLSIMKMYDQHRTEGFFPNPTEVLDGPSPVFSSPGNIANVQYLFMNESTASGSFTVDVYVSWYAGEPQRGTLQRSFQGSITGGESKVLSVNVSAPQKPSDATSDRPMISAIVHLPDGSTIENAKLGKEPQSRDIRVVTRVASGGVSIEYDSAGFTNEERTRINQLANKAAQYLQSSPDKRMQLVRDVLGSDRINQLIAESFTAITASMNPSLTSTNVQNIVQSEEARFNNVLDGLVLIASNDPQFGPNPQAEAVLQSNRQLVQALGAITETEKQWHLDGYKTKSVTFELTQDSMVNVWLDQVYGMDLSIYKNGTFLFSAKNTDLLSGRSISARMDAGTYEVRATPHIDLISPDNINSLFFGNPEANLHINVASVASNSINGKVSKSNESLVHSITISRFGEDENKNTLTIKPNLDTWIVIHGRQDKPDGEAISELSKSLYKQAELKEYQVLTLNWEEMAGDNLPSPLGGASWIETVAAWTANQLKSYGFESSKLHLTGHSWGALLSYAIARNLGKVGSIVALDPAQDLDRIPLNSFDASRVNFSNVAFQSIAFHSSIFGSQQSALTANYTFSIAEQFDDLNEMLRAGHDSASLRTIVSDATRQHGYAVTMYSWLLRSGRIGTDPATRMFNIENLMPVNGDLPGTALPAVRPGEGYEGVFIVNPALVADAEGKDWWRAVPTEYYYIDSTSGSPKSNLLENVLEITSQP